MAWSFLDNFERKALCEMGFAGFHSFLCGLLCCLHHFFRNLDADFVQKVLSFGTRSKHLWVHRIRGVLCFDFCKDSIHNLVLPEVFLHFTHFLLLFFLFHSLFLLLLVLSVHLWTDLLGLLLLLDSL